MSARRCAACGNPARKLTRAIVIRSESRPRIGLVCKVCSSCGFLVVPASLRILPEKPRKVPRKQAMAKFSANVLLVQGEEIEPTSGVFEPTEEGRQKFEKAQRRLVERMSGGGNK